MQDIQEAIQVVEQAVQLTLDNYLDRVAYVNNLENRLKS